MQQEGDQLILARIHGNFEKFIDNLMNSELMDDFELFDPEEKDQEYTPPAEVPLEMARTDKSSSSESSPGKSSKGL